MSAAVATETRPDRLDAGLRPYRIGVIRGDGTGPEVIAEALKVLESVRDGFEVELIEFDLGAERYLRTGETLPDADLEALRETATRSCSGRWATLACRPASSSETSCFGSASSWTSS